MSNLNFSGGPGDKKLSDFMSGRGIYLLLAVCLVGSGMAAWSAISGSFFDEGVKTPISSSRQDEEWEFPILENAEASDPSQPLPSLQQQESSQPLPASSELEESTEVSEPQPEQPISVFVLPVEGEVLQTFSKGNLVKNSTLNEWKTHNGVDIKADKGSEVVAIAGGVVKAVKNDPLWGYVIEVDHGNGIIATYCGLSDDIRVSKDDQVKTRDALGTIGTIQAESSLEPHLHFEVKKEGKYMDPFEVMGKV